MPLLFGTVTSDRVDIVPATPFNNLTSLTMILWVYPTSFVTNRSLMQKGSAAGGGTIRQVIMADTAGNLTGLLQQNSQTTTNDTPLSPAGQWYGVMWTAAVGSNGHVYVSRNFGPLVESTYSTDTNTGSSLDDSAVNLLIGCNPGNNQSFPGRIYAAAYANTVWTTEQGNAWLRHPRQWVPSIVAGPYICGKNGRGIVIDESGNGHTGTITGAIPTNDYLPRIA